MSIHTRPLWKLRLERRLPRWLLGAVAAVGLLASARYAIDPPHPIVVVGSARSSTPDLAAQGFASLFARAYLSWSGGDLEARRRALEPFLGTSLAPEAGMQLPTNGSQRVLWDEVVQERELRSSLHVYTVAAETVPQGLVYLAVSVMHRPGGPLRLAGYPAFVGPPAAGAAEPIALEGSEVGDSQLATVVSRTLRNYLAPAPSELAADLVPGADVTTPRPGLSLERVQSLVWSSDDVVVAVVAARSESGAREGARYTLAYEIEVLRMSGRWEVAAIEAGRHV